MTKVDIKKALIEKYSRFADYIKQLSEADYQYALPEKWTAEQQLKHLIIALKATIKVYGMPQVLIAETFGVTNKPGRSYEDMITAYFEKLKAGAKAPKQFGPEAVTENNKQVLLETLLSLAKAFSERIENFSEEELDTLCIPHPSLGQISLREMLYNAIYHAEHHQNLIQKGLLVKK